MMQFIISLHYHRVEETIVAKKKKILICHEKAITLLNTSTYFFFSNFHIFAMQIQKIYFYFFQHIRCSSIE